MKYFFRLFFLFAFSYIIQIQTACAQKQLSEKLQNEIAANIDQAKQFEANADYNQAAGFYSKAATAYWVNGLGENAVELFKKAIELNGKIGNLNATLILNNNIGMIYTDDEEFPKALEYFQKSLDIAKQLKRKPDIAASHLNIGNTQVEMGNTAAAIKSLEEANTIAKELNDAKMLRNCYSQLAEVYEKAGNQAKSSEYFSLYSAISRKVQQDEARKREGEAQKMVETAQSKVQEVEAEKQATEQELQIKKQTLKEAEENLEKIEQLTVEQQMHIDLLNKENELREATIRTQRMVRNIFIIIIIGVLGFAFLIYKNLKAKKKANALLAAQKNTIELKSMELEFAFGKIAKQNLDITSSINYAQRIQQAMMPEENALISLVPDSFIMLNPRDIVSGDFYWLTGYASPKGLKDKPRKGFMKIHSVSDDDSGLLIAAVDCTGHGVPGAFMSMIGLNLLESITRNGTVLPNDILFELHLSVRYLLKQNSSDNTDGMDMSVCCIKDRGRKLLFSGAKSPLYMVKNGEVTVIKGDSAPVGGSQKESLREFTLHTFEVNEPTSFYVFSDGYIDQFGGKPSKKFGSQNFRQLLVEINHLPMQQQKQILEQKMAEWKGPDQKQIDDMLVIGFKIGVDGIDI